MSLPRYTSLLRQQWKVILAAVLVALLGASLVTLRAPRLYRATATLFVAASADASSNPGLFAGSQFSQERVKSYAEIINSPAVTAAVVASLKLNETPEELAKRISAQAPVDTVLLKVSVDDPVPDRARQIADAVSTQFARLASQLETPAGRTSSPVKVTVVQSASLPTSPSSPNGLGNLILALVLGLGAGLGLALLRDSLDTSIATRDDVEEVLGLTTVGVIALAPEARKAPLITSDTAHSPRAESFKQLRSNLKYVDLAHGTTSIVVTSAVAEEGKSSTACNLAITLAEAGVRVVLVGADLRRPRMAEYLQLEGAVGLTDVLIGQVRLEDALQDWGSTGALQVLLSGTLPPNPSELLGSPRMATLLGELQARCDVVILDAPPLLPVTDAAVLSAIASGSLLVIRSGHTRRDQAKQALATLLGVEARVLGVVLNMVPRTGGPAAYTYSYETRAPRLVTPVPPAADTVTRDVLPPVRLAAAPPSVRVGPASEIGQGIDHEQ